MSEQDGKQVATLQRPTTSDSKAWKAYWKTQGQTWRAEPEIDTERQKYLFERRSTTPNIEQGIYPFGGIKLTRADIEWLLATHENGQGPVDWSDEKQRTRMGLDLRGAELNHENLSNLPLACIWGGLTGDDWSDTTPKQREAAGVHMKGANLSQAHLEGAILRMSRLEEAYLRGAYIAEADLRLVHLENAYIRVAHLEGTDLRLAYLQGTLLYESNMEEAIVGLLIEISFIATFTQRFFGK